jgi:hypothetical protein
MLLLASTVGFIVEGEGMNSGEVAGAVQVWAFIGFALAAVALTERMASVAPRARATLLALALAGVAGGVGYGVDAIQAALNDTTSIQEMDSVAASFALQVPGILFPLSFAAIGVALARTRSAPAWAAWLLVIGALLFPMSRIPDIEALAVAADVLLLLALVAITAFRAEARPVGAAD